MTALSSITATAALLAAPTAAQKSKRINTETILPKEDHPSTSSCDISCLNGGECTFIEYFDYPIEGEHGWYMGCSCPDSYHGGQCELLVVQSHAKIGVPVALSMMALLVGMAYRRRRQRQSRRGNEDRFNSVYMDNLRRDLDNICVRKEDDECSLEEVEFDRRDTRGSLDSIEGDVDAEYL